MSSTNDSSSDGRLPATTKPEGTVVNGDNEKSKNIKTDRKKKTLAERLPDWLIDNLKTPRTWKTFIRCMIAFFCTLVLLLDTKSLGFLGQAAFFSLITSVMMPPSMALSIFIFAVATLIVGMCLGWAWGCAAMAAGLKARDLVLLNSQIQTAQAGFNPNANIDVQYQSAIFHGDFLDPRSSAVFGVFLFVGAYIFGFIRAHKPRLTLLCVFGSIIMDLMCSYGPLFPASQYTIARMLLIPASFYIAIAVVCTLLIFPQSLNSIVHTDLVKNNLKPIRSLLELQQEVLSTRPSDHEAIGELAAKAKKLRSEHVQGVSGLEGQVPMLQLEVSHGQIGAKDLTKVFEKAKELGARAYALASFVMLLDEGHQSLFKVKDQEGGRHIRVQKRLELMEKNRHPGTNLDDLIPTVASSTADLRAQANQALGGLIDWIEVVNHSRWSKPRKGSADITSRETDLADLKSTLAEFRSSKHFEVLSSFRDLFDKDGTLLPESYHTIRSSAPSLFRCHVLTSNLIAFSLVLIELLEICLDIERRNPKAKWQLPNAFAKMLVKSANDTNAMGNPLDLGGNNQEHDDEPSAASSTETLVEDANEKKTKVKKEKKAKVYPRDPDAEEPHNGFHKFGRRISRIWKSLTSPQGIFALKYGIVSIALWIPQICRGSAYFTYLNRGLWALIMAQTGLGVFTGEQISSFVIRMTGTIAGLVLGMVVWYIGAGHGTGNPYGIAAASMVFMAPFIFLRITAPMSSMALWLMTGVTIVFVVGYSWVDEHIYQIANSGSGAALAGRRALLVIIGFTAAFIVMLFPRPLSARQIVRMNIAKNIGATSDLYGKVLGGVEDLAETDSEAVETDGEGGIRPVDIKGRADKIRGPFMKILARMEVLQQQMMYAKFEPGLKGPWPKKKYEALVATHSQLLGSLALLASAYARLTPKWCKRLEGSDNMHPAFIADCLALFALLQQSLRNGQPMPPTMPIFERMTYHSMHRGQSNPSFGGPLRNPAKGVEPGEEAPLGDDASGIEAREDTRALALINEPLTWELCHDEQVSIFATAIVALTHIANGLNDLQRIVISLVGEGESGQFDRAQERWGRYEVSV